MIDTSNQEEDEGRLVKCRCGANLRVLECPFEGVEDREVLDCPRCGKATVECVTSGFVSVIEIRGGKRG